MKSGVIFGNTDKLFDAERRWDLKEKGVQQQNQMKGFD